VKLGSLAGVRSRWREAIDPNAPVTLVEAPPPPGRAGAVPGGQRPGAVTRRRVAVVTAPARRAGAGASLNSAARRRVSAAHRGDGQRSGGIDGAVPRFLQAGLFYDPINAVSMREQLSGLGSPNVAVETTCATAPTSAAC